MAPELATILITDGDQRAALAVVRSLGSAGHRCIVVSPSGRSIAGASRYASIELRVPDAGRASALFAEAVSGAVNEYGVDVVIPVAEQTVLALLPRRHLIRANMPFPALNAFEAICNKERVLQAATALGIRVPNQVTLRCPDDARGVDVRCPVVLKPTRSVFTAADGSRGKVGVRWAYTEQEFTTELDGFPIDAYPILVQEAIEGPGIGVFLLIQDGRAVASFSHRRLREKPPSGGVSVLAQSEPLNGELLERSLALLNAFEWSGVAMVEYKQDKRTGEPVLMEINGRFWGSLQLAVDAGVDFPRLVVEAALGSSAKPVHRYDIVRSRWFWGDVDNLIAQLRDPGVGARARVAAIGEWLRAFGPGYRSEVLRARDPWPALRETVHWFGSIIR